MPVGAFMSRIFTSIHEFGCDGKMARAIFYRPGNMTTGGEMCETDMYISMYSYTFVHGNLYEVGCPMLM